MAKIPGPDHPFRRYSGRLSPPPRPAALNVTEVTALRQAHATGCFSYRELARIYSVSDATVKRALSDDYKPRRDDHG